MMIRQAIRMSAKKIYDEDVKQLIDETFQGTKSTCFAYGQTGSGKTYTMMGND